MQVGGGGGVRGAGAEAAEGQDKMKFNVMN
jgi:hypothetical protein